MVEPVLSYATHKAYSDEVAITMSFVPVFESQTQLFKKGYVDVLEDEEPEQETIYEAESLHFIFVLDRSGSMWGNRIEKAKEALKLFILSLPEGCNFTVISYGSKQSYLEIDESNIIPYKDEKVREALEKIERYGANMGSTNIATPMQMAIDLAPELGLKKRVILLTDGEIT